MRANESAMDTTNPQSTEKAGESDIVRDLIRMRLATAPTRPAVQQPVRQPVRIAPAAPDWPTWFQRILPSTIRGLLVDLGMWQDPSPLPPSLHLEQTLAVLTRYGWCRSLDYSPTGRMCIRGAQNLLEKTGHVTPQARDRAVAYMQNSLAENGIQMPFFAWNDLPDQQFSSVQTLLEGAASKARKNGE